MPKYKNRQYVKQGRRLRDIMQKQRQGTLNSINTKDPIVPVVNSACIESETSNTPVLPNEMDNYMECNVMGPVSQVRMKPGCLPTKFECQLDRRKQTCNTTNQSLILKKQRKMIIEESEKDLAEKSINSTYLEPEKTSSETLVLPVKIENIKQEVEQEEIEEAPVTVDKSIQVQIKPDFRNKAIQTDIKFLNQMTSDPQSSTRLPSKFQRYINSNNCTTSLHRPMQIFLIENHCYSDKSFVNHIESSPPIITLQRESTSDCSKLIDDYEKQHPSKVPKYKLLNIMKNPQFYIGVPKNCYYLIYLIEKSTSIPAHHILMCLKKIRLNNSFIELADDFSMTPSYARKIFLENIPLIATLMRPFIVNLDKELIKKNLPTAFRHKYYHVNCIIGCLEIEIEKPSKALNQSLSWSKHKKANTIKYLVSCTPNGLVNYNSSGYGGRIRDTCLVESCEFIKCLQPGMCVMANMGFRNVEQYLWKKGVHLILPLSATTTVKIAKTPTSENNQTANLKTHERVIQCLQEFDMIKPHACLNHNLLKVIDDVVTIACGLINLRLIS